jgi:hypothetical protein
VYKRQVCITLSGFVVIFETLSQNIVQAGRKPYNSPASAS